MFGLVVQAPQGREVYDRWVQLLREHCSAEGDDQAADGPATRAKLLKVATETAAASEVPKSGGWGIPGRKTSARTKIVGDGADGESTASDYVRGRVSDVMAEGWLYKKGHKRTNWTR
jgi:hypothetical protein